jgi:hypothetical protein
VSDYVQKMGADTLSLVVSNFCEYYARDAQCAFCEIFETYKTQRIVNVPLKNETLLAEAIAQAVEADPTIRRILINSGNIDRDYDRNICRFINLVAAAARVCRPERWKTVERMLVAMPPRDLRLIREVKDVGVTSIYFNLECYEPAIFSSLLPGKAEYGRDRMLEALRAAVAYLGPGEVYTNLIYGIQCGAQSGHGTAKAEHEILLRALGELAREGIIMTNTIYHSKGRNRLGPLSICQEALATYHLSYGRATVKQGLVADRRLREKAVFGGISSFPNCLNNEGFAAALEGENVR